MTANKHTPGPWVFYADTPSAEPNWHIVTTANRMRVVANVHVDPSSEMDIANARLIAAAPELLEAMTKKVQDAEQRVFEDWLEFNSPSGDHEAVQRQWLESNDYRGFIGEWREQLDAIAKAGGAA